jgi:hypothetical protein
VSEANRSFHIGGVDITIDAKGDGAIHLLASGHVGHFEGDHLNDTKNNEVGNAISFIGWVLANTYDAQLKVKETDSDVTYQISRGESSIKDYVESGRRVLNTEELYELLGLLEKNYAEPTTVAQRVALIKEYEAKKPEIERRAKEKLQSRSDLEEKEAHRQQEHISRAEFHFGHLMPAIRWTLSQDMIECDKERGNDILLALRDAKSSAGVAQGQDPQQVAALQAKAVVDYLKSNILEFADDGKLQEQLAVAIAAAETRKRQQGQGRGEGTAA